MKTHNLGYPRIGSRRELKKACEAYWANQTDLQALYQVGRTIMEENWKRQLQANLDLIPCNDFSFYDQTLDLSFLLGAIPERYAPVLTQAKGNQELDLYFAMARGYQRDGLDITAMEMTKWFDTNYHYIVPEFTSGQSFKIFSEQLFGHYSQARQVLGEKAKPVLIGPVSYLLLGKEKEEGFERIELIERLIPVYIEVLQRLKALGASWVQLDEPFLALDLTEKEKKAFQYAYSEIAKHAGGLQILLTTYFEGLEDNTELAVNLPVAALHLDLVRAPGQLERLLELVPERLILSLGVVDGRNVWKNDYEKSLALIQSAASRLGGERVWIAPSCSLLHSPIDLNAEHTIDAELKDWLAFASQKLQEISELRAIQDGDLSILEKNRASLASRRVSERVHKAQVQERLKEIAAAGRFTQRTSAFTQRQKLQAARLNLPIFPITTIGSFPQTADIRKLRADWKKGSIGTREYEEALQEATREVIRWQEELGIDVLVHGEFERNDMVEYFGEQLDGFLFTKFGWVQSYGSRCVKPPIIYGDVTRPQDMTVRWSVFAAGETSKPMKGMLTGPVTILQWSFVRDDQPREQTAYQIALCIRDEVVALEKAGIAIIQIDEAAIREGLPLRKARQQAYLDWAVKSFRISSSGVRDETQIHTHMCYSEFNDIIQHIARLDADVITIETSRSQMELLEAFSDFSYPNQIGPGVYDIHSPRVPSVKEMEDLLKKAVKLLPVDHLWVNPDCGLKTRKWPETRAALENMVAAAKNLRAVY